MPRNLPLFDRTALVAASLVLVFACATSADAQTDREDEDEDAPRYPTTEFAEGAKSASVTAGDITAGISSVRRASLDPNADIPVLQIMVGGQRVMEVTGAASGFEEPAAEASIAEMDSGNQRAEIYFSSYSGGAHCCSTVVVAEEVAGRWTPVHVGDFDGDGNYLDDVDGDGLAEIVTVDNRFLYQFDCYACSAAPLIVFAVRAGKAVNVTAEQRFLPAHRRWLKQIEEDMDPEDRWTSAGYLAGWVGAKARVGEGAEAMKLLRAHWDFETDVGEEVCLTGGEPENCLKKNRAILSFPDRLERFLKGAGFPL